MPHADFVHLRVHSAFSLSEGAIPVKKLAALCQEHSMPAVAVCDTNNLFCGLQFSSACAKAGVQPIIGCQIAISREGGTTNAALRQNDNVVLLVQNQDGYGNLLKIIAHAYLGGDEGDGDAEGPSVPLDFLISHATGLIALTGGVKGPVGRLLCEGQTDAAKDMLSRLSTAFEGRLYVELMRHGIDEEKRIEPLLVDLAYEHDLPLVATNEVFFSGPDMFEAHDALTCIAEGAYLSQGERKRLTPEHYFKSAVEMRDLFADLPEALDNTLVIAKRCAFMVETAKPILPKFDAGDGRNEEQALRALAEEGLEKRLVNQVFNAEEDSKERDHVARPYRERLEYELKMIIEMEFPGYFLIVADFIRWAKDHGIPVGPGRGSGAGSLVAWSLDITDLDPLRFGLLFERFLNPERISMPDFDIDFCQDRRGEVIRYVQKKYGRDRVAQIVTFGKLQARAALRDVGRVLEMPYSQVDRICKLIPNDPANPPTLKEALASEPLLRQMVSNDPDVERLMEIARKIEGLYRHASTHAAGLVIADRPLEELVPLYRDPRSDMPVTGFNMKDVEPVGLVKFDFLGLKTLTVLAKALDLIVEGEGNAIDLSKIPLDDATTFEMLGKGETVGVFQLESSGMRDILRDLKPDCFEDIIAIVALYRPGPMKNIPSYIKRKHGDEEPDYLYPTLEGILKETLGIPVYQEQVMQIAQELAGYTLGGADILRRAMGKKDEKEMASQRQTFLEGSKARGVPEGKAKHIFNQVAEFAGYGFNKSHAAAYALVAYQTAYLKANYPTEFLAASMTLDITNTDKLNLFRQELDRLEIPLLPPDINLSAAVFSPSRGDAPGMLGIRYALAAVKRVGEAAMSAMVKDRQEDGPYKGMADFAERLDSKFANKLQIENLARAGAFDTLEANRKRVFCSAEMLMRHASAAAADRGSGQIGLFGQSDLPSAAVSLPETDDWTPLERMKEEFDAVGFYLSGHPLDAYSKSLERIKARKVSDIIAEGRSGPATMAGTVIGKKERTSSKGGRYAFVQCSDASGTFEVTVFSETLAACRDMLEAGNSLFIKATAQFDGEAARFTVHSLEPLDQVVARTVAGLTICLNSAKPLEALQKALLREEGNGRGRVTIVSRVSLNGDNDGREVEMKLPKEYRISTGLLGDIRSIPGILEVRET
jgi:DNA polymerase III subunit alpha